MTETRDGWAEWLAERPQAVREKAEAFPPWQRYRVKPTGQLAQITSYSEGEDGTCETCTVTAWYEWMPMLAHGVFGMPFADLEPLAEEGE